jgi:hypothetical protein
MVKVTASNELEDANLLLDRANEQIVDFKAQLTTFLDKEAWARRIDFDPIRGKYIHKLEMGRQPGARLKLTAKEIWSNLRSSLDHLNAACARLGGAPGHLTSAHFPFAKTSVDFERDIKRRCRYVPEAVTDYFRALQPYRGGDERFYALASIRNTNEHWILTPTRLHVVAVGITRHSPWSQTFVDIPTVEVGTIHEIELFASDNSKSDYYLELLLQITFEGFEAFEKFPVEMALDHQATKVRSILDDTQAILKRLGLIS